MDSDNESDGRETTWAQFADLKKAARAELAALPPEEAQAAVEQILHPRLWWLEDPEQLAWPGDLADDAEDEGG
jgi:hypothetical protein